LVVGVLTYVLLTPIGPGLRKLRRQLAVNDRSARLIHVGLLPKQVSEPPRSLMCAVIYIPPGIDMEIKTANIFRLDHSLRHHCSVSEVSKSFEECIEVEDADLPAEFEDKPGFNATFEATFVLHRETLRKTNDGEVAILSPMLHRRVVRWTLRRWPLI
jgi:hypothetical protein